MSKQNKTRNFPEVSISRFVSHPLIIIILILFTSCEKVNDEPGGQEVIEKGDRYILKNKWNAMYYNSVGGVTTLQEGYIELFPASQNYKKYYKGYWHSGDGGLTGVPSEWKNWEFKDGGEYFVSHDSTFVIIYKKYSNDTAWYTPGRWIPPTNYSDSTYLPPRLDYRESFSKNGMSVFGFFYYYLEE